MSEEPSDVWEAPDKHFIKIVLSKGYGYYCPQDGSVCKVKVIHDNEKILSDVGDDFIKEIIIGDVDDLIERVLEACVRTMKNEEVCILKFPDPCQFHNKLVIEEQKKLSYDLDANDKCEDEECTLNEHKDTDANSVVKTSESLLEPATDEVSANSTTELQASQQELCDSVDETITGEAVDDGTGDCQPLTNNIRSEESQDSSTGVQVSSENMPNSDACDSVNALKQEESMDCDVYDIKNPRIYEVQLQLLSYTREPEIWEMSITEKWRRANYHKQKGMELYARGSYEWAFRRFGLALKYIISLEHDIPSEGEEGMNIDALKLTCYLNLSACQMRHHNYSSVVKNCSKALELQPDNSKALYRRGAAYIQLQEYEKAKEDLDKAQELEPKNQAIVNQQQLLKARVQKLNKYYAKAMKKMFS